VSDQRRRGSLAAIRTDVPHFTDIYTLILTMPFYCLAGMLPHITRTTSEIFRNKIRRRLSRVRGKGSTWPRHHRTFSSSKTTARRGH
jgi:hypothetical protein